MSSIRTIIIDDEADGRQAVALALAKYAPQVEVVGICESPEKGIQAIRRYKPNLVFLDINMPNMSGFDLLDQLQPVDFEIIFVSAYDQYAMKAIKFSALDYLVKPVDPDDLKFAVSKMEQKLQHAPDQMAYLSFIHNIKFRNQGIKRIAVPGMGSISFFEAVDIIFLKADGSYTTLFLKGGKEEVVAKHLKDFETMLGESGFCRVHHSYLINLTHVQKYIKGEGGSVLLTNNHHIDISRRKKDEFLKLMSTF